MEFNISPENGKDEIRPKLFEAFTLLHQQDRASVTQFIDQILSAHPGHAEALCIRSWLLATDTGADGLEDCLECLSKVSGFDEHQMTSLLNAISDTHGQETVIGTIDAWLNLFPEQSLFHRIRMLIDKRLGHAAAFRKHMKAAQSVLPEPPHCPQSAIMTTQFAERQAQLHRSYGERETIHPAKPERQYFVLMRSPRLNAKGVTLELGAAGAQEPGTPAVPALRLTAPFSQDCNHLNGIGFINTVLTWGVWPGGGIDRAHASLDEPAMDLRDRRLRLRAKFGGLDPKAFRFGLIVHTLLEIDDQHRNVVGVKLLKGQMIDPGQYPDGDWVNLEFLLTTDPADWVDAGNNPEVNSAEHRYVLADLD